MCSAHILRQQQHNHNSTHKFGLDDDFKINLLLIIDVHLADEDVLLLPVVAALDGPVGHLAPGRLDPAQAAVLGLAPLQNLGQNELDWPQ